MVAAGKRVAGQAAEVKVPDSPVTTWVVNHVVPVRWGLLVVGLIVLALVTSSWLGIILAIVVELLLQGALSLIAAQWPFEDRTATRRRPPEPPRRTPAGVSPGVG